MRRWITATALAITAVLSVAAPARAGLVPVQVSVLPEGGLYRFTYAIVLPTDSVLRPGDYFTIYDFEGFVDGTAVASGSTYSGGFAFSSSNTGPTPAKTLPEDDPAIPNLTWTYNGPEINIDASVGLGNFWALSQYPDTTNSWFTASTGSSTGETDENITPTSVPVPTALGTTPPVPEPATLMLAGLGLPLVAAFRRRLNAGRGVWSGER